MSKDRLLRAFKDTCEDYQIFFIMLAFLTAVLVFVMLLFFLDHYLGKWAPLTTLMLLMVAGMIGSVYYRYQHPIKK